MKLSNKILNKNSDEENSDLGEDDEDESVEEKSQDDGDNSDEEDEEEEGDENEGDEVDDDEDFVEENENVAPNVIDNRQSLGGGNKKVLLQKPSLKKKLTTEQLVYEAITQLNERAGSSTDAIRKYVMSKDPEMNEGSFKRQLKRYIKRSITDGTLIQIKRSFKISNKHKLKIKELGQKKERAKQEKLKEKEKLTKEKKKEKKTEEKKTTGKSNDKSKSKDKTKVAKKPKAVAIDDAKNKAVKVPKLDKVEKMPNSKSAGKTKIVKFKTKNKLARKSINLVIRPTPPRPKTMKKTKSTAVAEKKKIDFPAAESGAASNAAPAAVKTTGKGRKK